MKMSPFLKFLPLLFLCLPGWFTAQEEIKIKEAGLALQLPNKSWKIVGNQSHEGLTVYHYKRASITNKEGIEVIPNLAIIVEGVPESMDIAQYSILKRIDVPFEVSDVFANRDKGLNIGNAIAYQGTYEDEEDRAHTIYVVHIIRETKGVQIIMDITSDLFPDYESEFTSVLKSIKNL